MEGTKTASDSELYKIFIERAQGRIEITINKNLTINNILANLQDDGIMDYVLIHNNQTLHGGEKIKDALNDESTISAKRLGN